MDNIVGKNVDTIDESEKIKSKANLETAIKRSNLNVKELEQLYKKNYLLKQQIDRDKRLLKRARENFKSEIAQKYKEFDQYKENMSVIIKKNRDELAREHEAISIEQEKLEKDRKSFESLKKRQQMNFKLKKEKQAALLNSKKNQLDSIELDLKLKKEKIESLRKNLEYEIIEFEAKKRELTNNLERFNSLVASIGGGMERLREKNTNSKEKN